MPYNTSALIKLHFGKYVIRVYYTLISAMTIQDIQDDIQDMHQQINNIV